MSDLVDDGMLRHGREMGLNRLVFGALIGVYFTAAGSSPALLVTVFSYIAFGALIFAWLRWRQGQAIEVVLGCALIADLEVLSLCLHLDGPGNAALFPLYLWVIQGNGFRLGIKPLFFAVGVAFVSFAAVIATTPYWHDQPTLSFSLLAALVVLPGYSSTLIRKLSRARLQAEQASRDKSMFLAAISHELRTPLNAILGSVSLVEDTPLNEEQRSLFGAMRIGTQALLSLIGSILDFSRVEAGLMPVKHDPVDLAALLIELRDLVAIQARMKSLQLSIHASPDVPLTILGDRKHLLEVLVNLASNAVKFTETGGICLSVEMEPPAPGASADAGRLLRFEVSDTGIGIAPEAQERIFDVFSQADPTILDRFGGTGLGLALCRQLVSLMGGGIGVESRPGQGSTFWFTVALEACEADPVLLAEQAVPVQSRPVGAAVVLCDDPALVGTIEAMLRAQGLAVRHAVGLQGALNPIGGRPSGEILFLHRRDPHGDLPGDCAVLGRLDPQAAMPRILLSRANGLPLPLAMLRRHFMTILTLPASDIAWARACRLSAVAATRPGTAYPPEGGRAQAADAPGTSEAALPVAPVITPSRHRLHVLVADDNDINRRVVRKALERAGHRVSTVQDGIEALDAMEALNPAPFDLVLMDVNMPGMNGLETTQLYRLAMPPTPRLPILALTADATLETEQKCIRAGMDGCITKPVTPAGLIARIDALFEASPGVPVRDHGVTLIADHPRFPSAVAALDPTVLAELQALGGIDFVNDLLQGFIADAHVLIGRIDAAVDAQDMTSFRFELHAMCSAAANIGAAGLRDGATARDIGQATLASNGRIVANRLRHELACVEREWRGLARQSASAG